MEEIVASNVLEHVADLPALMSNLLELLREGGRLQVEVPYEGALTAWQDPTHVRAMNENSWVYYTGWFWYLGWFEHRFELTEFGWLDERLQPCAKPQAEFMRAEMRKVRTTAAERTWARTMDPAFGPLPEDDAPELSLEAESELALREDTPQTGA
jgi:SAM-dependent methyltransferase